jgi:fermentation-respiration switch protein FrsA (DUF1100 family)
VHLTFDSDGIALSGRLRLPPGDGPFPGLVLTGPFTGVQDQVVGTYADALRRAGFATLAFDHRGFGGSGGRRAHEDSQGKLTDLRAAVGVLVEHPQVDRVGIVGICLGGGYAVRAAAQDPRIEAVVGIAGAYNSPARFAAGEGYRPALRSFIEQYDMMLPAVAPDGGEAAMAGAEPWAYYGTERGEAVGWRNAVTRGSLHSLMTFDALGAADLLGDVALLVVHGRRDDYCSPDLARELHERAGGEIVWVDCAEHIDLYDVEPHVGVAVDAAASFLHRHLAPAT